MLSFENFTCYVLVFQTSFFHKMSSPSRYWMKYNHAIGFLNLRSRSHPIFLTRTNIKFSPHQHQNTQSIFIPRPQSISNFHQSPINDRASPKKAQLPSCKPQTHCWQVDRSQHLLDPYGISPLPILFHTSFRQKYQTESNIFPIGWLQPVQPWRTPSHPRAHSCGYRSGCLVPPKKCLLWILSWCWKWGDWTGRIGKTSHACSSDSAALQLISCQAWFLLVLIQLTYEKDATMRLTRSFLGSYHCWSFFPMWAPCWETFQGVLGLAITVLIFVQCRS